MSKLDNALYMLKICMYQVESQEDLIAHIENFTDLGSRIREAQMDLNLFELEAKLNTDLVNNFEFLKNLKSLDQLEQLLNK